MSQNKKILIISLFVYFVIFVLVFSPMISVLVSGFIADHYGCALNEGGTYPCLVGGADIGGTLNFMFVAGWFIFITVPAGAALGVAYTLGLIIYLVIRARNNPLLPT